MRKFAACFFLYVFCLLSSSVAMADGENARDFVQGLGDKVIAIVADTKLSDENKERNLTSLFVESVDINWIGRFVVGRFWRESSDQQQAQYMERYKNFLINSYVPKFRKYTDQKMTITKFSSESTDDYLVETSIIDQDGKNYKIDYKVKKTSSGKLAVYDIIAEGVSMITTQRSEFASILSREGMDALIKKLEEKKSQSN